MRALAVDFARPRRWPLVLAYGLALLALGLAGAMAWNAIELEQRQRALRRQESAMREELDARSRQAAELAQRPRVEQPYQADAALIARVADYDIGRVLASIESAQVAGVRVTGVEIAAGERTARIDVEVTDPTALLRYVDDLNAGQPSTTFWRLLRVQAPTATALGTATLVAPAALGARE